jgi:hypothetical protein
MTNNEHIERLMAFLDPPTPGETYWRELDAVSIRAGAAALRGMELATAALRKLAKALEEVHEDPCYQRVWIVHQLHCGPYKGKTYEQELNQAAAALAELEGK